MGLGGQELFIHSFDQVALESGYHFHDFLRVFVIIIIVSKSSSHKIVSSKMLGYMKSVQKFYERNEGVVKCCSRCGAPFPASEYYSNKRNVDGLDSACKICIRKATAEYYYSEV